MIDQVEKFIVRNHDLTMKWIRLPKTDQLEVLHLIYQPIFGCCIVPCTVMSVLQSRIVVFLSGIYRRVVMSVCVVTPATDG